MTIYDCTETEPQVWVGFASVEDGTTAIEIRVGHNPQDDAPTRIFLTLDQSALIADIMTSLVGLMRSDGFGLLAEFDDKADPLAELKAAAHRAHKEARHE